MQTPPIPDNEAARQQALCSLEILDSHAEERFDRITRAAQQHFQVAIALVSLVDAERQWFKSRQGLDASETPRDISFCGHAIYRNSILYIPDALQDLRFADNPLVTGPPHIRFYAGAPLRAPGGERIGTLCIIDNKPREFSPEELSVLRDLADEVEKELGKSATRMRFTIVQKLGLSSALLVLLSAGIVGGLFYNKTTTLLVEHALEDVSREVVDAGDRLNAIIDTQNEDVLFLANTPPIQGILRAQSAGGYDELGKSSTTVWMQRLETIFKAQLRRKSSYLTIRFIDARGQEQVVVSRRGQELVGLGSEELQNKAHRDYVSEALKLPSGSVYVSEVNLNREHGVVTRPLQEVIRSATPVYDEDSSRLAGVLSITADIGGKLRTIQNRVRNTEHSEIYITNQHGDYLLHPDLSKAYGFERGEDQPIQKEFPSLSTLFLPDNKEVQVNFKTESDTGWQVMNFTKIFFDANNPQRFIAVVISHDYSSVVAEQSKVLHEVVLWALLLIIPGAGLGVLFSLNLTRPIKQITQAMDDYIHQRKNKEILPVKLNNEIGMMARSYQSLIGQVAEAHADLENMNSKLETSVALRTQALEMSEIRQRSIVENIIDGLITIDDKGTITLFNPAASRIFGYSDKEVLGRSINILMPETDASEHDDYLQNYLTTGEKKVIGTSREVEGRRKDGSTFPMELAVSEMLLNDERIFTGVVRDITERKKIERMKSEFISTVSHELRTPLTSIRGALGLVLGKAAEQLPEKMRKMLEMADRNSERLTLLINDILDLEKIESGVLVFEFHAVDLVTLARQAVEDNAGYAHKHQIDLLLDTTLDQAPVLGDSHRLLQVFANLISNAVKYSAEAGQVEISVTSTAATATYRVAVRDHGAGIPEEFSERIFQRFAQADSSDTREKGGTGLGLSITRAIVERHGGSIDYESEIGKGTVFYFDLPIARAASRENPSNEVGIRVLICEDNADVAEILAEMLASEDLVCDIATSVAAARSLLAKHSYRLLLLDLSLPDADGLVFLRELRKQDATAELPVIVVSGRAEEGRVAFNGDAVAVVDWIQKPLDRDRLERALHEALRRNKRPRVLHVEDDADIIQITKVLLEDTAQLSHVATVQGAREILADQNFDLVILDIGLADGSGLDLLDLIKGRCPVVIFSAQMPSREISEQVTAALTKSITSNAQLLATIKNILKG